MPLEASDLIGATKRYNSLPSHEKEVIDRKVEDFTKQAENLEQEKINEGKRMISALSSEAAGYCHKVIVKGAVTIVTPSHVGGNEFKEVPMTEREKAIEKLVRSIKYSLTVEAACELLNDIIKEGAV